MLQILLAFLAISIVSVTGYSLVEQLSLQQIMVDQRENARRLDVAADAIAGNLVAVPGLDGVFAPAPTNAPSSWSQLPASVGGINSTIAGVPFLYCPLGASTGTPNGTVNFADSSSYDIEVKAGVVVASNLPVIAAIADFKPIAFIVAAGRDQTAPPSCEDIIVRNNRPFVPGGLVKVVSRPSGALGEGSLATSTTDFYVSAAGGGSGRAGAPTSLNDALAHWAKFRPSAMTIHLTENVTASDPAWSLFVAQLSSSPSRLTIEGSGFSLSAPSGDVQSPATLSLSNISVVGPRFIVNQGDEVNVQGTVSLAPSTGGSGMLVEQGGRLNVANGALLIGGSATNGVESAGDVILTSAAIAAGSGRDWSLGLSGGGRLWAKSGIIGSTSARTNTGGLAVAGAWSVTSDTASQVAAGTNGSCWQALSANDATFAHSLNGVGAVSSVTSDPANPGLADPSDPAQVEAYQQYRREVDERQRARQTNHSNFICV